MIIMDPMMRIKHDILSTYAGLHGTVGNDRPMTRGLSDWFC